VHGSRAGTAIAELGKSRLEAHVVNELRSEFAYGGDEGVGSLVPTSFIGTPLTIGGTSAGVLALGMAGAARQLGQEELELAEELADRASMALENARLYELERETSRALQLSLLASRPIQTSLVTAAMRYVPATEELDVGGDWYDAIERPDGAIVIAAGDVVGRGLKAATTMGKLRSALGALALVVDDAGGMLDRLDSFAEQVEGAHFATVACVLIEPTGRIHYSLAGHPPPLLIRPDGEAAYLEGGRGLPLGVIGLAPMRRSEALEEMPAGSTLILYTDGLIERSGISLDEGLKRLERAAVARAQLEAEVLCDELIAELTASARDDVAIVCLRFEPADTEIFSRRFVTAPAELGPMRAALREWLAGRVKSSQELNDIVLACAEACSNAVQHAYERHDGEAALELRVTRDRALVARVRDFGRWREQPASSLAGRGLHIMRGLMDQVHVHVNAGGTTVVMQKQLLTEPTPDRLESASASSG
jgi:serine/threonine-protein kinase RsbW